MKCLKCEKTNDDPDRSFCSWCGGLLEREDKNIKVYQNYYNDKVSIENKFKILKYIFICVSIISILFGIYGIKFERNVSKYINLVKTGSFETHPDITIADGFEKFFTDTTWEYISSKEGYNIVEFRGYLSYKEEDVITVIQFHIYDDNTFDPSYLSFVDVSEDKSTLYDLIDRIMINY